MNFSLKTNQNIRIAAGFTLIEVLVSMTIFITTISLGVLSVVTMDAAAKRVRIKDQSIQSAYFLLDSLSRSIRMGSEYECADATGTTVDISTCASVAVPGFAYRDQDGRSIRLRVVQVPSTNYYVVERKIGNEAYKKLHDDYSLKFKTFGFIARGVGTSDVKQPYVSLRMQIVYSYKGVEFVVPLQTTLTQRQLDIDSPI